MKHYCSPNLVIPGFCPSTFKVHTVNLLLNQRIYFLFDSFNIHLFLSVPERGDRNNGLGFLGVRGPPGRPGQTGPKGMQKNCSYQSD